MVQMEGHAPIQNAWALSSGAWDSLPVDVDNDMPLGAEAMDMEPLANALNLDSPGGLLPPEAAQNPISLRFSVAELEDEYNAYISERHLKALRVANVCAVALFTVFFGSMVLSMLGETDDLKRRYHDTSYFQAASAGLSALYFIFMFTKLYRRMFATFRLLAYLVIFALVVISLFLPRGLAGDGRFSSACILSVISVVLVMGQFSHASMYIVLCVAGLVVQISVTSEDSPGRILSILLPGVSASLFPLLAIYLTDRQMRRVWLSKRAFNVRHASLDEEKEQMEKLLRLQLPGPILALMRQSHESQSLSRSVPSACVVFVELYGWADTSSKLAPADAVAVLNLIFTRFDTLAERYAIEKIKTIGPIFMAASGLTNTVDHVTAVARFAMRLMREWRDWKSRTFPIASSVMASGDIGGSVGVGLGGRHQSMDLSSSVSNSSRLNLNQLLSDVSLKIGVHVGEVVAGVVGDLKFCYDIYGDTVNTASRVCKFGAPNHVRCTAEVKDYLNPNDFGIESMGMSEYKGKGLMETFDIAPSKAPSRKRRESALVHRKSELGSSIGRLLKTRGIKPALDNGGVTEGDGCDSPVSLSLSHGDGLDTIGQKTNNDSSEDNREPDDAFVESHGQGTPRRKRSASIGTAEEAIAATLRRGSVRPIARRFAALTEALNRSESSLYSSASSLGGSVPFVPVAKPDAIDQKALFNRMTMQRRGMTEGVTPQQSGQNSADALPNAVPDVGSVVVDVDQDTNNRSDMSSSQINLPSFVPLSSSNGFAGPRSLPESRGQLKSASVSAVDLGQSRVITGSKSSLGSAALATLTAAALAAAGAGPSAHSTTNMSQARARSLAIGSGGSDPSRRSSRSLSLSTQMPIDIPAFSRADALTEALKAKVDDLDTRIEAKGRLSRVTLRFHLEEVETRFRIVMATRRGQETAFHMLMSWALMLVMVTPDIASGASSSLRLALVGARLILGSVVCLVPAFIISRTEGMAIVGKQVNDDMRSIASSPLYMGRYTRDQRVRRVLWSTIAFEFSYAALMVLLCLANRDLNNTAFCHVCAVVLYVCCVIASAPSFLFVHLLWIFAGMIIAMFGAKLFGLTNVGISTIGLAIFGILITVAARYRYEKFVREQLVVDLVTAEQERDLVREKGVSEELLHNILPPSIAKQLAANPDSDTAMHLTEVTVLAMDVISFTARASAMTAEEVVALLNSLFNMLDSLVKNLGGIEKICTIGDAYIAASGVPEPVADHAERVCMLAMDMVRAIMGYNLIRASTSKFDPVRVRIGVHSGGCVAGVMGGKVRVKFDLYGDAMDTAVRLEQTGQPLALHISSETIRRLQTLEIFPECSFVLEQSDPLTDSGLPTYLARPTVAMSTASVRGSESPKFRASIAPSITVPTLTEAHSHEMLDAMLV